VSREAVGQATSTINVIQRVAGSVGTALLAVVLQRSIRSSLGVDSVAEVARVGRAQAAPALADAFGASFWVAFGLVAAALVPALLLPRIRPGRTQQKAAAETLGEA
jgi:hypothetical protein